MNIFVITLGCPKNTVDSEVMAGLLGRAGHTMVGSSDEADAVLINTCGFIESAKTESLDTIMEALELKKDRPALKVIATGCLTQRYRAELGREIPELDGILGVNDFHRITELLDGRPKPENAEGLFLYDHTLPRRQLTPSHYAYVKISEGCSRRCSFCAIPAIRGPLRSRLPDDILAEAEQLLTDGVRELILIGQDTTAYGRDRGPGQGITPLLDRLAGLGGDFWIRMLYTYPTGIGDELLEVMAHHPAICPYLDLPLQHAHPEILGKMDRPGSAEDYLALMETVRQALPGVALRTSLITGFPGEEDRHFHTLMDFVAEARFDHLGVFTYSDEEGTPASHLPDKVPAEIAEDRRQHLMELQQDILRDKAAAWLGRTVPVIVDGILPDADVLIQARTRYQAPEIDGVIYLTDGPLDRIRRGDFVTARIHKYLEYDFAAEVITIP